MPVQGTLKLQAQKVHRDGERQVALTRTAWRVRGELSPYVAGQQVVVRFFRDGRKIHEQVEQLQPIRGGTAGMFRTPFRSKREGRVAVEAVHLATPEMDTVRSEKVRVNVMKPSVSSRGRSCGCSRRGSRSCTTRSRAAASTTTRRRAR